MKKGIFLGLVLCAISATAFLVYQRLDTKIQAKDSGAGMTEKNTQTSVASDAPRDPPVKAKPQPTEDPDILDFIKKLLASKLSENAALSLLQSSISQNKKAVVLETYNEMGGVYTDRKWGKILRELLLNSNEWPELANKASKSLAIVNESGEMDSLLLNDIQSLSGDDVVKRSALADALSGKESIESALTDAASDPEAEVLSRKHADLLNQPERLQQFETSKSEVAKVQYLRKYISSAESLEELTIGVNKGTQDPTLKNDSKPRFVLAASESNVPGKSTMLFSYWQKLLPKAKEQADFIGVLNLAIQQAAYSERDKSYAENIILWLNEQAGLDPKNLNDPRIELSIAMVNACTDKFVKKDLCPSLLDVRKKLETKLRTEGFQSYITGA